MSRLAFGRVDRPVSGPAVTDKTPFLPMWETGTTTSPNGPNRLFLGLPPNAIHGQRVFIPPRPANKRQSLR